MPESATLFLAGLKERLRRVPRKRIVFPEGTDTRVQSAAHRLIKDGLIDPILLDKDAHQPKYAHIYYARRRAKGITQLEAAETASKPLYHAALMVAAGDADGAVGGAVNTTAETVRAARSPAKPGTPPPPGSRRDRGRRESRGLAPTRQRNRAEPGGIRRPPGGI